MSIETLIVWGLGALGVFYLLFRLLPTSRVRRGYGRPYLAAGTATRAPYRGHDPTDAADQLRAVMSATFSQRKVMGFAEYKVFKVVEDAVRGRGGGCRVFSQTALGEVIESSDRRAHSAINSKRVDVLVIGPTGLPLVAIEYQGKAHYQRDAAARDAVKKEALRKAGVEYLEVMEFHAPDDITRLTREALDRALQRREQASPATPTDRKIPVPD